MKYGKQWRYDVFHFVHIYAEAAVVAAGAKPLIAFEFVLPPRSVGSNAFDQFRTFALRR